MPEQRPEPSFPHPLRPAAPSPSRRSGAARPALHRISGPAELLQAIPYLLGFHPHDSLVLVGLHDGRLTVTARLDLPAGEVGAGARVAGVPATIAHTVRALAEGGATEVIAAVYGDGSAAARGDGLPGREVVQTLSAEAGRRGVTLLDAMLVSEGLWWSYLCSRSDCCPSEGTPVPDTTSSFAVAATVDGVVPLVDRAALAALLDPVDPDSRRALRAGIAGAQDATVQAVLSGGRRRHDRSVVRRIFAAARAADLPGWDGVGDDDAAVFGAALAATAVRDAVWMGVDDGRIDGRELWRDLGRRLPAPYCAAPLFLFGWSAWRAGHGALASIAAERTVAADPTYTAADLLLAALDHGVDPRRMPKLRVPRSAGTGPSGPAPVQATRT